MDLWVDTNDYFELRIRKKNHPRMLSITLKSYILKLFEIGKEEKSLNLCKDLIQKENSDYEIPNIFSLLNEYYLIKKFKTEKQYEKWIKSKKFKFKNLKKKLDEFIQSNPDYDLKSKIKYAPYSWRNPDLEVLRNRKKSREFEDKSIIKAIDELENDIFLVSELFETSSYEIIKIQINSNKNHLKLFN
jgi:hypothetical protein